MTQIIEIRPGLFVDTRVPYRYYSHLLHHIIGDKLDVENLQGRETAFLCGTAATSSFGIDHNTLSVVLMTAETYERAIGDLTFDPKNYTFEYDPIFLVPCPVL